MAKLYYDLIRGGRWTLERVPARWRAAVEALLAADGGAAEDETEREG